LKDTVEYLKFLNDIGISELPVVKEEYNEKENTKTVEELFDSMRQEIINCSNCPLGSSRVNPVFGEGNINTDLMFIGEAPGFEEDKTGKPFVGKAGGLLTKIINAMGLSREDVFIGNVIKCRPPGNRDPLPEEMEKCKHFIDRQIELIKPKVICTLGRHPSQTLLNTKIGITKIRGKFTEYKGIKLMPTFHPSYLLRDSRKKKETWEDIQAIRDYLKQHSDIFNITKYGKN